MQVPKRTSIRITIAIVALIVCFMVVVSWLHNEWFFSILFAIMGGAIIFKLSSYVVFFSRNDKEISFYTAISEETIAIDTIRTITVDSLDEGTITIGTQSKQVKLLQGDRSLCKSVVLLAKAHPSIILHDDDQRLPKLKG